MHDELCPATHLSENDSCSCLNSVYNIHPIILYLKGPSFLNNTASILLWTLELYLVFWQYSWSCFLSGHLLIFIIHASYYFSYLAMILGAMCYHIVPNYYSFFAIQVCKVADEIIMDFTDQINLLESKYQKVKFWIPF